MSGECELKICFTASSGGHWEQLMKLKPLMKRHKSFLVTEETDYLVDVEGIQTYYLKQVNRHEKMVVIKLLHNIVKSLWIFLRERPDAVICTGVLATLPMCVICKLFGKKVIYIESFAMINSGTKSGKFVYRFADRFYVQWESMLTVYPKAIYRGKIY